MNNCYACQRAKLEHAKECAKKERMRMNINPECEIAREILYQTVLLKNMQREMQEIKAMLNKAGRSDATRTSDGN